MLENYELLGSIDICDRWPRKQVTRLPSFIQEHGLT